MLCSGKYHLPCFCVRSKNRYRKSPGGRVRWVSSFLIEICFPEPQRTRQRQWPSARQHLKAQPHWELAGTLPIILPFRCGRSSGVSISCYLRVQRKSNFLKERWAGKCMSDRGIWMQLPLDRLAQWLRIKPPIYLESYGLGFNPRCITSELHGFSWVGLVT